MECKGREQMQADGQRAFRALGESSLIKLKNPREGGEVEEERMVGCPGVFI